MPAGYKVSFHYLHTHIIATFRNLLTVSLRNASATCLSFKLAHPFVSLFVTLIPRPISSHDNYFLPSQAYLALYLAV